MAENEGQQEGESLQGESQIQEPQAAATVSKADFDEVVARLAKTESALRKTKDEAAERRVKLREKAEEEGQYRDVIDSLKAELAGLTDKVAGYQPAAERWMAYEEAEATRIAAEVEAMPDSVKTAVELAGSLEAKRAVLDVFKSQALKPTPSAAPAAPAQSPKPPLDLDGVTNRQQLKELKKQNPEGWQKMVAGYRKPRMNLFGGG